MNCNIDGSAFSCVGVEQLRVVSSHRNDKLLECLAIESNET